MEKSKIKSKSVSVQQRRLNSSSTNQVGDEDRQQSNQFVSLSLSNPTSPDQCFSRDAAMNSMYTPPSTRRPTTSTMIQRPVPTFPSYHLQPPSSSTGGSYSAFAPFNTSGGGLLGSATLGYEDPAVTAARRANWNRIRQHRSLDGESLQLLNDPFLYQNETVPPADPQVPSQPYTLQNSFHLSQSPRFYSQGNLMVGGAGSTATMPSNQHMGSACGPFSNALLAGLSGLNLEHSLQNVPISSQQHQSHNPHSIAYANSNVSGEPPALYLNPTLTGRDPYSMSLPVLQREYEVLRREYESAMQKLNSTMNSIKTFWSPELKKERAMRKDEATKFTLLQEQMKMGNQENQKQASLIHQLQDELHCQYELSRTIRNTEIQSVPREEYEATRLERDRLHRELLMSKDTMRELELQVETQRQTLVSRDESIKKLLDMLQSKGLIPYGAVQDRLELETAKSRLIELEKRCLHFETLVHQKDQDVRVLQEECISASEKIKQQQIQHDRFQRLPIDNRESGALHTLLETKVARIEQLEQRIALYEDEINRLRDQRLQTSRNFADKTMSDQQFNELKHKAEKAELELSQKQNEIQAMQTRVSTAEEQTQEFKKHLDLVKHSNATKDQQINSLQADVESLRTKIENRTETIEQKTRDIHQLQHERTRLQAEIIDLNEQLKVKDGKIASFQRKLENCEEMLKEKDRQQDMFKQRLSTSPHMMQQKQVQDQIDELMRERERMLLQIREQRDRMETERMDELDSHRREVRDLRMAIESLQKEITDRQILIESQNEKISDVNRELGSLKLENKRLIERGGEIFEASKEIERLNKDLQDARNEVERLLKIVQAMDKEKESINLQIKELEKQYDDSKSKYGGLQQSSSLERKTLVDSVEEAKKKTVEFQNLLQHKEARIEELEEALKESCSITAERELLVAQQKQQAQILDAKMNAYKDQITKNQKQYDELNAKMTALQLEKQEKDNLLRSLKHERRKHLEEVLQLKEEALLAAISEKDAHIALLETSSNRNPDEVETLRKHKEKLMKRLKEENARRVKLLTDQKDGDLTTPLVKEMKTSPNDQIIQVVRYIELQKKKLRVFIDQLLACILDIDPELLIGLPRTQQSQGVDVKLLKKLTHEQLIIELQQRETDSLTLQHYANSLLQRMSRVQPTLVRRAIKLLDSFNGALMQTSPVVETHALAIGRDTVLVIGKTTSTTMTQNSHTMALQYSLQHRSPVTSSTIPSSTVMAPTSIGPPSVVIRPPVSPGSGIEC